MTRTLLRRSRAGIEGDWTDFFAGGGGASTGATLIDGVTIRIAANHWKTAVDVHNANHPDTAHVCADISQYDPRRFPRTRFAWFSPECTHHSRAQGKRMRDNDAQPDLFGESLPEEAAERSRATMWDVVRFSEVHLYDAIIVENVVEVRNWPPFRGWLYAMESLGYEHHIVYLNSMHAQANGDAAPQSRDRIYIVFWQRGLRRPEFDRIQRPKAYCSGCDQIVNAMQVFKNPLKPWGRYGATQQYVYRCPSVTCRNQVVEPTWIPASSIIDWSLTGQRIGDRLKPLKPKTLARIKTGIDRFWINADGVAEMAPILTPVEGREGKKPASADYPLRTQTTRSETGIAFPPFFAELRGGRSTARLASRPLSTVTASGKHHGLIVPYYGATKTGKPVSDPIGTVTTRDRFALATSGPTPVEPGKVPEIDDCTFRMLEPSEIALAMAFPDDYVWMGNRRERVRMAGNAVTPPAARDLVWIVMEAVYGEDLGAV